jgi:hypothetical protein
MATVVTLAGSLTCGHTGSPVLSSTAKLTAGGSKVIAFSSVTSFGPYVDPAKTCKYSEGGSPKPCATTSVIGKGEAAKLTIGRQPVLLSDLAAKTGPDSQTTPVTVVAGQSKLTAV